MTLNYKIRIVWKFGLKNNIKIIFFLFLPGGYGGYGGGGYGGYGGYGGKKQQTMPLKRLNEYSSFFITGGYGGYGG